MSETPVSWEIILKYFDGLTDKQQQQFEMLYDAYFDWNSKINVVSRKDFHTFYERHVLHSLAIATIADFESGTRILDVGTGGGFPGIPLAILFPECKFHLVDSIGKKIKVVKDGTGTDPYKVDGITGGTITSNGVNEMIKRTLKIYAPYLKANKG